MKIVIVTLDASTSEMPALAAHAKVGMAKFGEYEGFLGGNVYESEEGTRLVSYQEWSSNETYKKCVDDPAWHALDSTRHFMDAVREGRAHVDVRFYERTATGKKPPQRRGRLA